MRTTYVALLDGGRREVPIEVTPRGPGRYDVRVADEVLEVDAFEAGPQTLSLLVGDASHTARLDARGSRVHVRVGGGTFPIELLDERRLRLRRSARLTRAGRQVVEARLPGRVVAVRVKLGDVVRAGQPLVAVEALQMENELSSPKDGRVVELHVQEGQAVEGGAALCAVE
jgi:biotin carboxyl carrier protein